MDFVKVKERLNCIISNRLTDTFIVLNALAALEILNTYDVVPAHFIDIIIILKPYLHCHINMRKLKKGVHDKTLDISNICDNGQDTDESTDDENGTQISNILTALNLRRTRGRRVIGHKKELHLSDTSTSDSTKSSSNNNNTNTSTSNSHTQESSDEDAFNSKPIEDKITKMLKEDAKKIESMFDHKDDGDTVMHNKDEVSDKLNRDMFDMFDLDKDGYLSCFEALRLYNMDVKHSFVFTGPNLGKTMVKMLINHKRISFGRFQKYILDID